MSGVSLFQGKIYRVGRSVLVLGLALGALSGCVVVDAAGTAVGTAADVASTAVSTTAKVVTAPVR
ncbi:hypothetical protein AZA_68728 [Nitrospirillum viridazoti Y2]|uniref:Uncharacterized protein n=1 Tax=Nitrospirillum amazonense TaxID=28077 RepID=A0A560HUJ5_9PROT|nr:hypothetical protein [Nitrospirillum amazonense]EGY02735.1 hypothetical protein AZA_68728 [Nitrospirillum amazonense Y2]TWB48804.1 hypothetical protein FBZ92_1285 [Nitrospirillum amazonense]